jgi:hypothetical protein
VWFSKCPRIIGNHGVVDEPAHRFLHHALLVAEQGADVVEVERVERAGGFLLGQVGG